MKKTRFGKTIIGLGIETSCDETAVSLVKNGCEVITSPIFSQIELHQEYGGIVPELASRAHLEKITHLLQEALTKTDSDSIDYVAVTTEPGLKGSLLIGYNTALAVSLHFNIPLIKINHLEAHLYAVQLSGYKIEYPFLGLLVSGGNSAIYKVDGLGQLQIIGNTLDDACGEALDKAAQLLFLSYPGGPEIEKLAQSFLEKNLAQGIPQSQLDKQNPLPKILKDQKRDDLNFSFSGIKTALMYLLQKDKAKYETEELAYYFQARLIEIILRNLRKAVKQYRLSSLIAAGGVIANRALRKSLLQFGDEHNICVLFPEIRFCTDNAAMVASLGFLYFQK